MSSVEDIRALIVAKGEEIRKLKAEKADISNHLTDLISLKEQFAAANGGVPYDPPKQEKEKKEKVVQPAPAVEREGPSKKELNKLAKKEKKSAYKAGDVVNSDDSLSTPPASVSVKSPSIFASVPEDSINTIYYHSRSLPEVTRLSLSLGTICYHRISISISNK